MNDAIVGQVRSIFLVFHRSFSPIVFIYGSQTLTKVVLVVGVMVVSKLISSILQVDPDGVMAHTFTLHVAVI